MSYTKLYAWKESFELAKAIYKLTEVFPSTERYVLVSQMRRATLSVPSNLAEGSKRGTTGEFKRYCWIAYGSASELEMQLRFAKEMNMAPANAFESIEPHMQRTLRLLHGLTTKATNNQPPTPNL